MSDEGGIDWSRTPDARQLVKYFVAGASARVTAAVVMSPIDTIKTRLQFQGQFASVRKYANARDAFVTILKEEGIWGFFKGLPPRLMYITPAAAVSFMFYEQFKAIFKAQMHPKQIPKDQEGSHRSALNNPLIPLAAGALARLFGTAARTPFDILRQRLQILGTVRQSEYKGKGTFGALGILLKVEGIRGLWTGFVITVVRDVPFAAIYFLSYEVAKEVQTRFVTPGVQLQIQNYLVAGAVAGALAATCTIPFDVVKTRLQTQPTLPVHERKYNGIMHTFRTILKEEGPVGLTRGLGPRLMYLCPAASLTFAAYESYKKLLGLH